MPRRAAEETEIVPVAIAARLPALELMPGNVVQHYCAVGSALEATARALTLPKLSTASPLRRETSERRGRVTNGTEP